jgi:hypothetical protein
VSMAQCTYSGDEGVATVDVPMNDVALVKEL